MSPKKNRWLLLTSLLLVAGIALAACATPPEEVAEEEAAEEEPAEEEAAEEEPAEEEAAEEEMEEAMATCADNPGEGETIVIYQQAGLTGPLASILGPGFVNGTQDAVQAISDAGGICGADVRVEFRDTEYVPENELAAYEEFRELDPRPMFVLTYNSGATIVLADLVAEDKIVNIAAGLQAEAAYNPADGYTVLYAPIYSDQFAGFVQWVSDNWADVKPEGAGDEPVVGVIGWASSFGAGATTPEALAFAESIGVTVLPLEEAPLDPAAELTGQVQSLSVQGANVIYNQSLSFTPARVIGAVASLGLSDQILMGGVNWSMNTDMLGILGDNVALADGYYAPFPYAWWTDDVAEMDAIISSFEAGDYPEGDRAVGYFISYAAVDAARQVIEHAVDLNGFENLSGETFMNAFIDLGTVTGSGVLRFDVRDGTRAPREAQIRRFDVAEDGSVEFAVAQDFFELPDTRPAPES